MRLLASNTHWFHKKKKQIRCMGVFAWFSKRIDAVTNFNLLFSLFKMSRTQTKRSTLTSMSAFCQHICATHRRSAHFAPPIPLLCRFTSFISVNQPKLTEFPCQTPKLWWLRYSWPTCLQGGENEAIFEGNRPNHIRTTSEPRPNHVRNHVRTTSEPHPNHVRTTSEPRPNHIRTMCFVGNVFFACFGLCLHKFWWFLPNFVAFCPAAAENTILGLTHLMVEVKGRVLSAVFNSCGLFCCGVLSAVQIHDATFPLPYPTWKKNRDELQPEWSLTHPLTWAKLPSIFSNQHPNARSNRNPPLTSKSHPQNDKP